MNHSLASNQHLKACHCCGMIQLAPPPEKELRAYCWRCMTPILDCHPSTNIGASLIALSALILYIPAILLPMLHIEKMGHIVDDSLLSGVGSLLLQGNWLVGIVVFVFSILIPPIKLTAIFVLANQMGAASDQQRAQVYRMVEWVGRWGMLDIMLVALLLVFVKLGSLIVITAGPGLIAYGLLALLSLLASTLFNPYCLWK